MTALAAALENVVALLYGVSQDRQRATYARINFAQRAKEERLRVPKLGTFVSNRVTLYEGQTSSAFAAVTKTIQQTIDEIHRSHRNLFADPRTIPSKGFLEIPDYHSACVVASMTGTPLHKLKAGPRTLPGQRVPD